MLAIRYNAWLIHDLFRLFFKDLSMINISVNNEIRQIATSTSLNDFLQSYCEPGSQFAVAINGEFVPRARYASQIIIADDTIDIVSPVGGG